MLRFPEPAKRQWEGAQTKSYMITGLLSASTVVELTAFQNARRDCNTGPNRDLFFAFTIPSYQLCASVGICFCSNNPRGEDRPVFCISRNPPIFDRFWGRCSPWSNSIICCDNLFAYHPFFPASWMNKECLSALPLLMKPIHAHSFLCPKSDTPSFPDPVRTLRPFKTPFRWCSARSLKPILEWQLHVKGMLLAVWSSFDWIKCWQGTQLSSKRKFQGKLQERKKEGKGVNKQGLTSGATWNDRLCRSRPNRFFVAVQYLHFPSPF